MKVILVLLFLVLSSVSVLAKETKLPLKVESQYKELEPTYNEWGLAFGTHTGPLTEAETAYTFSVKNYIINYKEDNLTMRYLGVGPLVDSNGRAFLSIAPMGISVGRIHFAPEINIESNFNTTKLGFSVGYNFK